MEEECKRKERRISNLEDDVNLEKKYGILNRKPFCHPIHPIIPD
jgi:hypothetical protein